MTSKWLSLWQHHLELFQLDQELEKNPRECLEIVSDTSYLAFLVFAQQLSANHQCAWLPLVVKGLLGCVRKDP